MLITKISELMKGVSAQLFGRSSDGSLTEIKVSSLGSLIVDFASARLDALGKLKVLATKENSSNDLILAETAVLFNESAAIATQALAKVINVPLPAVLHPDGLYQFEMFNPSYKSDMTCEVYNQSKYNDPEKSPGSVGYNAARDVYVGAFTAPKRVIATNVDTLPDVYSKNIQGAFLGDSVKLMIKNLAALDAAQVQTTLLSGSFQAGDLIEIRMPNPAGVMKSSLDAIQKQTIVLGADFLSGTLTFSIPNANGIGSTSAAAINYNDTPAAPMNDKLNAMLVTAGYLRSGAVGGTQVTASISVTGGGNVIENKSIVIQFSNAGTLVMPLMTAEVSVGSVVQPVKTQTTIDNAAIVSVLKTSMDALLEFAGWTKSDGTVLTVNAFSGALSTTGRTITYNVSISTIVPVPTFICTRNGVVIAGLSLTARTTTFGATPVSVKIRKV